MRILKFLFFSLIGLIFLAFLVFFFGREIFLAWGISQIKSDYNYLLTGNFASQCSEQFSYSQDYSTQIRFTSEKEYNLEILCADFTSTPIVLASKKLPPLLYKKSFATGFFIGNNSSPTFIKLVIFDRSSLLYTDDNKIHSSYFDKPDLDYEQGPFSSCQSHGYQCCSLDLQSGMGNQIESVIDCPKSCYESCLQRPNVLSFNSQPPFDDLNRLLVINSGETVAFSYILGNGKVDVFEGQIDKSTHETFLEKLQTVFYKAKKDQKNNQIAFPLKVMIDFGDGEFFSSENTQDSFDHVYSCQNSLCYFQAKITVEDARGVLSANDELTKITIKVNQR